MTTTPPEAKADSVSNPVQERFDCVYFLMFAGWETEFRSNRWNFATRWARHLPVILVQPTLGEEQPIELEEPETRIPNTSILRVRACPTDVTPPEMHRADSIMVAAQIRRHMATRGFRKPLLWLYNPWLARPFVWLPSEFRFMHATEDWPRFPIPEGDHTRLFKRLAIQAVNDAELVVAVSSGVAEGIASATTPDRLMTVTNGCDFAFYSNAQPDVEVINAAVGYERIGIFAGNIGAYFNLPLMLKAARRCPTTLFCLFGRESFAEEAQAGLRELRACPNIKFFGEVPPERIPALYAAAHFGFIPYVDLENLRRSGFALKLLEMAAGGLPVVSTEMNPMRGLAASIHVTSGDEEFLEFVSRIDKRSLTTAESQELIAVARANDYDLKFEQIVTAILSRLPARAAKPSAAEDSWVPEMLQFSDSDSGMNGSEIVLEVAERYLTCHGVDAADAVRVGHFAMRNALALQLGSQVPPSLNKMLTGFSAKAARADAESDRTRQEAKRAQKLTAELAKANEKIAKLKANEDRLKGKTLKMRIKRLCQSWLGRSPKS